MTRATVAKICILVILAFIMVLPEFFVLSRVSKVNFLCLPYPPCEADEAGEGGGRGGRRGGSGGTRGPGCSSWQAAHWQKWKEVCKQENQMSLNPASDSDQNWFMCETDLDMAELQQNLSSSALRFSLEVSVELQLRDMEELNLTLYGLGNRSSLQPHPPEEEKEEQEEQPFYCCPPTSDPTPHSHCLLWLTNQTVVTAAQRPASRGTAKDEWQSTLRALWLVLLCVVLLAILSAVLEQIYIARKAKVHPRRCAPPTEPSKGRILDCDASRPWAELQPIQEIVGQEDSETFLDGAVDHFSTAHLHHRSHHGASTDSDGMQIL